MRWNRTWDTAKGDEDESRIIRKLFFSLLAPELWIRLDWNGWDEMDRLNYHGLDMGDGDVGDKI